MGIWKLLGKLWAMLLVMLVVLLGNSNQLGGKEASKYITNDNFHTLTGTITVAAGSGSEEFPETGYGYIEFPTGFTKNNCVILTQGTKDNASTNGYCYGYTPENMNVFAMGSGCFHMRTILGNEDNKIAIEIDNYYTSQITVNYKIVLMKIN